MNSNPYHDSAEHVSDELDRLDLVLRLHLEEWWAENGSTVDEFRGLYVSDETVDGLLRSSDDVRNRSTGSLAHENPQLLERIERKTEAIRVRERATVANGRELRLLQLAEQFGLGRRHRDALMIALAPELDHKYETIVSYLQDDVTKTRPTVGFVLRVLCHSERERLQARTLFSPGSPLLRGRLVRLSTGEKTPRPSRVVNVDDRIVDFLLGNDEIAAALDDVATVSMPTGGIDDLAGTESQAKQLDDLVERTRDRMASDPPMVHLHGPEGAGKKAAVLATCAESETPVVKADAGGIDQHAVPETLQLLVREARLREAALYVAGLTPPPDDVDPTSIVERLDAFDGPVFLSGAEPLPTKLQLGVTNHDLVAVPCPAPTFERRKELWRDVEGLPDDVDAGDLAGKFRFTGGQIDDAVRTARHLSNSEGLTAEAVYQGCRAQSSDALGSLARQIDPHYTWDDIVLPTDKLDHLREVAAHIEHQGRVYSEWGFEKRYSLGNGLNVLFTGPSGTGKTMAAEIIAHEAGLDLYKIDLSSVVSKYIGETEKNLRKIFDEAEDTNAILLFDEADAIFGKRTEVKDSHDRYANIEVNYLLQRVEEHDGIVILTTNFKQNIDDAFLRRIHRSVDFPRPDRDARAAIWRITFPAETPVEDLDVKFLASQEITGGNIKNVALTAAFMAAEEDSAVRMDHVVRALRREFQKIGKLVRPEEFGKYRGLLA